MPNWAEGTVTVEGKPENITEFLKLFLFEDTACEDEPGKTCKCLRNARSMHFARSHMNCCWKDFMKDYGMQIQNGLVTFDVSFAWSAWTCLIEGYPQDYPDECMTIGEACRINRVSVTIDTEEPGCGFTEHYEIDAEGKTGSGRPGLRFNYVDY